MNTHFTGAAEKQIIFNYYMNLSEVVSQAAYIVMFRITRDAGFIIAVAEVLIRDKNVLSSLGKIVRRQVFAWREFLFAVRRSKRKKIMTEIIASD